MAAEDNAVATSSESAWRSRVIERSTRAARERASAKAQQYLDAARAIMNDKGSTEFTVQEVVDRSTHSLRSFYQYFDGKYELLLTLFEEEMGKAVDDLIAASSEGEPLDRLERVTRDLYELCAPSRVSTQPLFSEFALRLLVDHPEEVAASFAPLINYIGEVIGAAADAGLLRPGSPRRMAAIVVQTAAITAGRDAGARKPITGDEVWEFCLHAIVPDSVADEHLRSRVYLASTGKSARS